MPFEQTRPKVLVFVHTYLPGYKAGGPIRSIANLAASLGAEIDFRIVTMDRDMGEPTTYPGLQAGVWTSVGRAQVLYLSPRSLGFLTIYRLLKSEKADFLYLNSFFGRPFSILPMLARALGARGQTQVILAPRGEFASGALRLGSVRKRVWIGLAGLMRVYKSAIFQASSTFEERDIRHVLHLKAAIRSARIVVASDIPASVHQEFPRRTVSVRAKEPGQLRIVFLSRISPMKNLLGAIRMLRGITGQIEFDIYGPVEDSAYWSQCVGELQGLPSHVHTGIYSELEHSRVSEVLGSYHVLLLPTLGENFGHVIHEALCAGIPVLISDQTLWRGLESKGAGWEFPVDREDLFSGALSQLVAMDSREFEAVSERARSFAHEFTADMRIVDANRALFFECATGQAWAPSI